jgi:hypothetical protein
VLITFRCVMQDLRKQAEINEALALHRCRSETDMAKIGRGTRQSDKRRSPWAAPRFAVTTFQRRYFGSVSTSIFAVSLSEAESRSVLDERALVCGRHIFGWYFPFRVAQLRDARARGGKLRERVIVRSGRSRTTEHDPFSAGQVATEMDTRTSGLSIGDGRWTNQRSVNACTPLPLPSKELPEVTNSIFPTGVAAEFIDPVPGSTGISKVLSKSPVFDCAS